MKEIHDKVIEFSTDENAATLLLHKKKYVNRIKKLAESRPDEVGLSVNADGTICATIPLKWIKISPPRQISEKQQEALTRGSQKT